ncbi:MAG: hypothetical protein KI790_16320, partial [Cyclobacteriaceae bacterium]|nr:hypothetical protein [Cyclobacteriaceae bacterium HetDA_MAG_MS6]
MHGWVFIGIGLAIFLGALILSKSKKETFDYILVSWLLLNGIHLFFFFLNFSGQTGRALPLLLAVNFFSLLTAPMLYMYVRALVIPGNFRILGYWYHLIPFVFMVCTTEYYHFFGRDQEIILGDGLMYMVGSFPFHMRWYGMVLAFFSFLYPLLCLYMLYKHRNRIANEFSYQETITLSWLRHWITLEIIGFWVSFIIIWAGSFRFVDFVISFQVVAAVIVVNIAVIGFFGLKQGVIFKHFRSGSNEKKYQHSPLSSKQVQLQLKKLQEVMDIEKPYLNSMLTIHSLANQLGISRHYLSQIINQELGKNFYDYINGFRVDEF